MRLTSEDREMLPEWVTCGQQSYDCFCWLNTYAGSGMQIDGKMLRAYKRGMFLFLYGRERNQYRFYGIFNVMTYELTDVSRQLRSLLGFTEGLSFRSRRTEKPVIERHVKDWLAYYLEKRTDLFYALDGELIPAIERRFIEKQAAVFFLNDAKTEDIRYVPEFRFGEEVEFTMKLYLLCLQKGEQAEQAIARQWIKRHGVEMFQQKVIYGCIRNEFDDITSSPRHWLHREKEKRGQIRMKARK